MDLGDARSFLQDNYRAVFATRRLDGSLQTSPVVMGLDDEGRAVISSRETAYKTKDLKRDPRATLCVMNDRFYCEWIQIDGGAEMISLPDAMDGLIDYHRRIAGEHPDWNDYRTAMQRERRLVQGIEIEHAGSDWSG